MDKDQFFMDIAEGYLKKENLDKFLDAVDHIDDKNKKFVVLKNSLWGLMKKEKSDDFERVFKKMLELANTLDDMKMRNEFFLTISQFLLKLPCEEQQKYIQKFVGAYDTGK